MTHTQSASVREGHHCIPAPLSPAECRRGLPDPLGMVGEIIGAKYLVEHVIGEGSMGVVLGARHLELDEKVAVKVMRREVRRDPEMQARFAREAKIASRIRNDNVVRVMDAGESPLVGPYIVMEYVDGITLDRMVSSAGGIPLEDALRYAIAACDGLAAAHAVGVIHRDIKPANLLIVSGDRRRTVKLLDFGISKAEVTGRVLGNDLSLGETTSLMGSPLYMSPEQIRCSHEVDERTDVWSLGVVLYELVTGQPAFAAPTIAEICRRILEDPCPLLDSGGVRAPPSLQKVIERCLKKNPNERFASVGELATALRFLQYDEASAPLVERPRRLSFEWVFAIVAMATFVAGAAAIRLTARAPGAEEPSQPAGLEVGAAHDLRKPVAECEPFGAAGDPGAAVPSP